MVCELVVLESAFVPWRIQRRNRSKSERALMMLQKSPLNCDSFDWCVCSGGQCNYAKVRKGESAARPVEIAAEFTQPFFI